MQMQSLITSHKQINAPTVSDQLLPWKTQ